MPFQYSNHLDHISSSDTLQVKLPIASRSLVWCFGKPTVLAGKNR